jgi:hypothetical protein
MHTPCSNVFPFSVKYSNCVDIVHV